MLSTDLADAARKSLAADPATLAWVLSTTELATTTLPEGVSREEVLAFRRWLEVELRRRAAPPG